MWDRISREICAFGFDSGLAIEEPPLPARVDGYAETLRLHIKLEPGGVCRLHPYPLTVQPYKARIPCVSVPLDDLDSLESRWLAAGEEGLEVTFLPG